MPELSDFARRLYAALTRVAPQWGEIEAVQERTGELVAALVDDPELRAYILDPERTQSDVELVLATPIAEWMAFGDLDDVTGFVEHVRRAKRESVSRPLRGATPRMELPAARRTTTQVGWSGVPSELTRIPRAWPRMTAAERRRWLDERGFGEGVDPSELEPGQAVVPALAGPARVRMTGRLPRTTREWITAWRDEVRDQQRRARQRARGQLARERRMGVEIERGPGGTVTAGPRKRKRRKPRR
jgi:hypothetical protein